MEVLIKKTEANYGEIETLIKIQDDLNDKKVLNELAETYAKLSKTIEENAEELQLELDSTDNIFYRICVENNSKELYEEDVFSLFIESEDEEILAKGEEFIKNIVEWLKSDKVYGIWADDESPLGLAGASKLAIYNLKYIPLFIELMEVCDNDHEVYLMDYIDEIISTHGYVPETINLLAHRMAPEGSGQHGLFDQVNKEELIEVFREKPELKELFFKTIEELTNDEFYIEEVSQYIEDKNERIKWVKKILGDDFEFEDD